MVMVIFMVVVVVVVMVMVISRPEDESVRTLPSEVAGCRLQVAGCSRPDAYISSSRLGI